MPLVTVWGLGLNDHRRYTLPVCRRLVVSLQSDGCAVMLGVRPEGWVPAADGIPVVLERIEHLGAETLCHMAGGAVLRLSPEASRGLAVGQGLRLAVNRAVLFGPDGARLPLAAARREPAFG
jgi:hypothetical protein